MDMKEESDKMDMIFEGINRPKGSFLFLIKVHRNHSIYPFSVNTINITVHLVERENEDRK